MWLRLQIICISFKSKAIKIGNILLKGTARVGNQPMMKDGLAYLYRPIYYLLINTTAQLTS